ncbi:S1 family peptidase [Streptomyces sp. NPDC057638]|uniref:S1 family peptidase n=1 Tax=Streptomyces sp. NPDC057638 TaxID=3346190 RepID=UPI00368C371B
MTISIRRVPRAAVRVVIALVCVGAALTAAPATSARAGEGTATTPAVRGGDALIASGARCALAFNARRGTDTFGVMASLCAPAAPAVWSHATTGVRVGTSTGWPATREVALVHYDNPGVTYPGEVDLGDGTVRDMTGAGYPSAGQQVCQAGQQTGLRCGRVQAVNVTVNLGGGLILYNAVATTICSAAGDGNAPLFASGTALGFRVGSGGSCATFHLPIAPSLAALGLTVY